MFLLNSVQRGRRQYGNMQNWNKKILIHARTKKSDEGETESEREKLSK